MKSKVAQAIDMFDYVDPVQWPSCVAALEERFPEAIRGGRVLAREVERLQKRIEELESINELGSGSYAGG